MTITTSQEDHQAQGIDQKQERDHEAPPGVRAERLDKPPRWLIQRSSRWFVTLVCSFSVFVDTFQYSLIVPVMPFALTERAGVAPKDVQHWVSVLLSVYAVAILVGSPICGLWVDKTATRQWPFLSGLVALAGSTVLLCLGRSIAVFIVARLLQGLSAAVVWTIALVVMGDRVGKERIGECMGWVTLARSIGSVIGPFLGGIVYARAGYYSVYAMSFTVIFLDIVMRLVMIDARRARHWDPTLCPDLPSSSECPLEIAERSPPELGLSSDEPDRTGQIGRRHEKGRRRRGADENRASRNIFGNRGGQRGPRKAVAPDPEFKLRHTDAMTAFISGDFEVALEHVKAAIRVNPEIFAAHSLYSEILLNQGHKDEAVAALFTGAHTRPKDPTVWAAVAKMILEIPDHDRYSALKDAVYCYSRIIDLDHEDYNVRFQRAAANLELGFRGKAMMEYERLLNELPRNMRVLRHLAETYTDKKDVERIKGLFDEAIAHYMSMDLEEAMEHFSWSDINIYSEFFGFLKEYEEGLKILKRFSRWLLGRAEETFWDMVTEDDREFDARDFPRRIKQNGFEPGKYPVESYGLGLPLELRIKMGIYRLNLGEDHKDEALAHFEWLDPDDSSAEAKLWDFGDLFREVGDCLYSFGMYHEAKRFLEPLQKTEEYADVSFYMTLAECFRLHGSTEDAERCYEAVIDYDDTHIEARVRLAKLYEECGKAELAFKYVNEAVLLGRQATFERGSRKRGRKAQADNQALKAKVYAGMEKPKRVRKSVRSYRELPPDDLDAVEGRGRAAGYNVQEDWEAARLLHVASLYEKLQQLTPDMRDGDEVATEEWLDTADSMIRDFRSNRVFYPYERHMMFLGYSRDAKRKAMVPKNRKVMDEMEEMANRLHAKLENADHSKVPSPVPTEYRGIKFGAWLDIFLEYALILAGQGDREEAYDALAAASDASVWYHDKQSMLHINVCRFACALRLADNIALAEVSRWFTREYQFTTSAYHLFAALGRMYNPSPSTLYKEKPHYKASPTMKYMLRQVKAMDYSAPADAEKAAVSGSVNPFIIRSTLSSQRAALSCKDENGEPIPAQELDIALLALYGHILYSSHSYTNALAYFFRAYALDKRNPVILLSIALSYVHHALKRQSENRHYLIIQGLSFLEQYRTTRLESGILQEEQEAEFNTARLHHMLGLAHLAIKGYVRCLELSEEIQRQAEVRRGKRKMLVQQRCRERARLEDEEEQNGNTSADGDENGDEEVEEEQYDNAEGEKFVEDFATEAAVALQGIYATSGQGRLAREITEKYLVI